jgi:hypothetical protein
VPSSALAADAVRDPWLNRDPLADSLSADSLSYVYDHASRLVAQDERLTNHIGADPAVFVVVDIGAADSYRFDLDQHFSWAWSGNRSFLYADIVGSIEHGCLILHFLLPSFSTFLVSISNIGY